MKTDNLRGKKILIKIVVFLFIILMCVLIYIKVQNDNNPDKIMQEQKIALFDSLDKTSNVNVTKYMVYGTHFNIEGTLDIIKISGIQIDDVDLVIRNLNGDEMRNPSRF